EMAWAASLGKNNEEDSPKSLYLNQCAVCHGETRSGSPPAIPSLAGLSQRMSTADIISTIRNGRGRMQGFPNLQDDQVFAVLSYLKGGEEKSEVRSVAEPALMKYHFRGYRRFLDPDGYPAVAPP